MIFWPFILFWVFASTSLWMLPMPLTLVFMREIYLDRRLKFFWLPVVVALLYLLFHLGIEKSDLPVAGLAVGKIFACSLVFVQLMYGLLRDGPSYLGARVGTFLILTERCLILEKKVVVNAFHSFRARRNSKPSLANRGMLAAGLVLTLGGEFLRLSEEMRRLYRSRGANPVTSGWVVPSYRKVKITYGDILLIVVIGVIANLGLSELMPPRLMDSFTFLPLR